MKKTLLVIALSAGVSCIASAQSARRKKRELYHANSAITISPQLIAEKNRVLAENKLVQAGMTDQQAAAATKPKPQN